MEQILTSKESETIFTCYNCSSEVSIDAIFCKSCGSQIKCKICKSLLEEGSSFCINCGTQVNLNLQPEKGAINNFDYTQKGNSKTVKAKFTNEVGGYFAGFFNNIVTGHPIPPRNPFKNSLQITSGKNQNNGNAGTKEIASNIQDAEILDDYSELVTKIFKESETGKLEIIDNRLKEKSKLDKMKRLTVLFLYAKRLMGIESVSREELNEIIVREKLAGANFRNFLSKEGLKYFSVKENGNLSLLAGGEDYAKEILEQIANSDFKPVASKAGRKSGKKSSKDSSNSSNSKESKSKNSLKPSALEMCKTLVEEKFFDGKRKMADIVAYCQEKKGEKYSSQNISNALKRLLKDKVLDRETNKDGGYEYWKK